MTVTETAPTPTDPSLERNIQAYADVGHFLVDAYAQSGIARPPHGARSHEEIDASTAGLNEKSVPYLGGSILTLHGKVNLSAELNKDLPAEELRSRSGFLDEDSFSFVWQTLERTAAIDQSMPAIEAKAEEVITKFKRFIDSSENFERARNDTRLSGVFHLNAASEFGQLGDFETARAELEAIPEAGLREQFLKLLAEAASFQPVHIDPETSVQNLRARAGKAGAEGELETYRPAKTKVVTNRAVDGFMDMVDPLSDGRAFASVRGADSSAVQQLTATSKDNANRREIEKMLGHKRGVFYPRVIYGTLVDAQDAANPHDVAWEYGDVRYVLKDDSRAVAGATYTYGDTLNGTKFTADRVLLRDQADVASGVIKRLGSAKEYVETQLPGLRLNDIDAVIIQRHSMTPEVQKAVEMAELQGMKVTILDDPAPAPATS